MCETNRDLLRLTEDGYVFLQSVVFNSVSVPNIYNNKYIFMNMFQFMKRCKIVLRNKKIVNWQIV